MVREGAELKSRLNSMSGCPTPTAEEIDTLPSAELQLQREKQQDVCRREEY